MGPVSIRVRFRPLRIGWCIDADSLNDYITAVRLSHVFWGGRFNPIIPCSDREMAKSLISTFGVDALYNISRTPAVDAFIKQFRHLQWPAFREDLFVDTWEPSLLGEQKPRKQPTLLDVTHPAHHLFRAHVDGREKPSIRGTFYRWGADDPLRFVLLACCGAYPESEITGQDYAELFEKAVAAPIRTIDSDEAIPADLYRELTPNVLTGIELRRVSRSRVSSWLEPGFYHGDALSFGDLVAFWNLRASGIDLFFFDPNLAERLRPLKEAYSAFLRSRPPRSNRPDDINVWTRQNDLETVAESYGVGVAISAPTAGVWNGLNGEPPTMAFEPRSVLGASVEDAGGISVTFQLPEKPFFSDPELHAQMVVVSLSAENLGGAVLTPPFIPRLNEYYGREMLYEYAKARAERDGLGVIQSVTSDQITVRALSFVDVIRNVFGAFGMRAQPSPAGLVGTRLIDQMGGLQGCRVFKIAGVRALIRRYPPTASFERTEAITTIGNNDLTTGRPRFEPYERLFIERREKRELKPEDAFLYLLKKDVFRAGLRLTCPTCQLGFWTHVDDLKSITECVYCGKNFGILTQLKDRNWAYRRSGLFGREDNQGGGIPVAVTLQQLETALYGRTVLWTTGIELAPEAAQMAKCETDFVLLVESSPRSEKPLQLVIGECKDRGGEITQDDVEKLAKVAQAFDDSPCQVFILYSKLGQFSADEVDRCKKARRKLAEHEGQAYFEENVILLSARELEPYSLYEQTEKEFEIPRSAISLEDFAVATDHVFFNPKQKRQGDGVEERDDGR